MRLPKIGLVCWLMVVVLGSMVGCRSPDTADEAAVAALRAEVAGMQAELQALSTRTAEIAGQAEGVQATAVSEQDVFLQMSLQTALELVYQTNPPQSLLIPIDRLAFYRTYDEFKEDWTNDKNLRSWVKLALVPHASPGTWQLYHNTDVISDTVTWDSPVWRRHIIQASWQPGVLSGEIKVEQEENQIINGHAAFLAGAFMEESLAELDSAVTSGGGNLQTLSPMVFLVHDGFGGHDDLVLALIENSVIGPDPWQDSPLRQYCSRCFGLWCRWRCWRY